VNPRLHRLARCFGRYLCVLAAVACASTAAVADGPYPERPIKWLVGYPAGGGSDFLARTIAAQLSEQVKQPVLIDNRPGAAGMIGAEAAARSPADGYTVFTADNGILIYNPALYKSVSYNPEKDYAPVGLLARVPLVLVSASSTGIKDLPGALSMLKANPGKHSYASPGIGSPHHLAMELFKQRAGVFAVHIPYRGAAPAMQDVMGGQVPLMVVDISTALPHIRSGKLVALAAFSIQRLPQLPDVPTTGEAGYKDTEAYAWQGLVVPAATPVAVRERLTREIDLAMNNAAVKRKLAEAGWETTTSDSQQMARYMAAEKGKWHKLIAQQGIRAE
jgi:tripartite-type tricarboxylate transporter receptor subunit TctC